MNEALAVPEAQEAITEASPLPVPVGMSAGLLATTGEERERLYQAVNPLEVEIRPDGLVFLPWVFYHKRLTSAFGTEWAMLPDGKPKIEGNLILWPFSLYIRGQFISYAVGQQEYQPTNKNMTYGDAIEGARSNALMRLSKHLGVSLELWEPQFVRDWKTKYAASRQERGFDGKPKTVWFKKSTQPDEPRPNGAAEKPGTPLPTPAPATAKERKPHDREIKFGKDSGTWLSEMSVDKLEWYADMFLQNSEDPTKAKYKKHNLEMHQCCLKELETRSLIDEPTPEP